MRKLAIFLLVVMTNYSQGQSICREYIPNNWDDSRYRIENIGGDSIVTDIQSGLIWQQCTYGLLGEECSQGIVENLTWQGALESAELINSSTGFAGYTDWRVPNLKELNTIQALNCYSPSINNTIFPNTIYVNGIRYWTSTPAFISNTSWVVSFFSGESDTWGRISDTYVVRLVRGK
ncbi:MAG: DUF1566 domain-containing protein [Alcanivoracaceae bacterium]|nr:DUF1566 domain-containing protein [Alcanivoracaceae bacterium]